jgi:octaprenyl-diphosphate synthase
MPSARRSPETKKVARDNKPKITPAEILAPLHPILEELEVFLEKQCDIFEPGVAACVRYVANNQGKRLRPALAIFSAHAQSGEKLGKANDDLLKICAVVELVHIATLVHDDIMDGAELRRNRLTAATKWGHEVSVLLGDCLFAHALALAASYPTPFVCRRVAEATNIVCSGEILQTQRRFDLKLNEADYIKMIEMKTGALFAVACELGAYLAGANPQQCQKFYEFGRSLGIAYQIYDDCLDLFGAEKEIGKSLGTDFQKGKLTLPVILLLQEAQKGETQLISSILLNEHANSRGMLTDFIQRYGTLEKSAQKGQLLLKSAISQLDSIPVNEGNSSLQMLATFLDSELSRLR